LNAVSFVSLNCGVRDMDKIIYAAHSEVNVNTYRSGVAVLCC